MKIEKLVKFNVVMGILHAIQGVVILLISQESLREITSQYFVFNEATQSLDVASRTLFQVDIGPLVALFFFMSAFAHLYIATVGKESYVAGLKKGINKVRWYEYSASASLMIVLIAMLSGIFNIIALIGLFTITALMNLMGLMMEVHNQTTKKTSWLSFNIGSFAGVIPWVLISIALWASQSQAVDGNGIPGFVFAIFVSLFLFFNTFAINMFLQYKKVGKWADYLYGERVYIILSLVAKSLLAWQIFGGTLQP